MSIFFSSEKMLLIIGRRFTSTSGPKYQKVSLVKSCLKIRSLTIQEAKECVKDRKE